MVLLRGLNYDYSAQQNTQLAVAISSGSGSSVSVDNVEGFAVNDYIVVNPRAETAEIVKVATVPTNTSITTTAVFKFAHSVNEWLYRIPYNTMVFYESSGSNGPFTPIGSGSQIEMQFTDIYTVTEYSISSGSSNQYYKRTFLNATTSGSSDIALADMWQINDETFYITPAEMRSVLQFNANDPPDPNDMATILRLVQDKIDLDLNTSNPIVQRIATFLLGKSWIMRSLGTKALSKGYITINIEGRQITKAWQELILEAENTYQEYQTFVLNNGNRSEVTKTNFLDDTTVIDGTTRKQILDLWQGTQNIMDLDSAARTLYGRKRRTYD